MSDRPDPELDVEAVLAVVAAARGRGDVRVQTRTAEIGGQTLHGQPFKTVTLDDPPAVHFPDARSHRSTSGAVMGTLFVIAFLAAILAIVSIAVGDWLFFAIFAAVAVICGGVGWRIDQATAVAPESVGEGYDGLTLTPEAMIVADRGATQVVQRSGVIEFGVRQESPTIRTGVKHREYVDVVFGPSTQRINLQPWVDKHQRAACETWLTGRWPPLAP